MRFRIHRGSAEIGGNCVEVTINWKIAASRFGLPLDAVSANSDLLPPVAGLADGGNPDLLGVVLSHPHSDHYGLLVSAHPSLPLYMGDGAWKLLGAAAPFVTQQALSQSCHHLPQPRSVRGRT